MSALFGDSRVDLSLPETRADLVQALPNKTKGFSISGVQIKAQLAVEEGKAKLVDHGGDYILKPSPEAFPNVAENEHLTLTLMRQLGFAVPECGLIQLNDEHLVFVIKRYDRVDGEKLHQEDAMQALGLSNTDGDSKYLGGTYLDTLTLAKQHGGLAIAKRLFDRLVFSYLVGNDDHHLKNISFILNKPFRLAPAYDVLNTAIYGPHGNAMALRFFHDREPTYYSETGNGFYSGGDFSELAEAASIPPKAASAGIGKLVNSTLKLAPDLIERSYLPTDHKAQYLDLIKKRAEFLNVK